MVLRSGLSHRFCAEYKVTKKESAQQSPGDRNLAILRYLNKYYGEWKNKRQINTYQKGSLLNPARLEDVLLELDEMGVIEKRESQNPQARPYEYRITLKGKEKLEKCLGAIADLEVKHLLGLKREVSDED